MSASPYGLKFQPVTINGTPYPGALLYCLKAGTTWPGGQQNVYVDEACTSALANPLVADATGTFPAHYLLDTQSYKFQLTDSAGNVLRTDDNISGQQPMVIFEPQALAPSSPVEGTVYEDSVHHLLWFYDGNIWRPLASYMSQQILTAASGTYTPSLGTIAFLVEQYGGGGQGGGCPITSAPYYAGGQGGQAGGYARKLYAPVWGSALAASYPYTNGAGGSTGTTGNPGQAGTSGTFDTSHVISQGGYGGGAAVVAGSGFSPAFTDAINGSPTGGAGDVFGLGAWGAIGMGSFPSAQWIGGAGGNSPVGGGGASRSSSGTGGGAGNAAPGSHTPGANSSWAGGGGGASAGNNGSTFAGGAGAAGVTIVTEYFGIPSGGS